MKCLTVIVPLVFLLVFSAVAPASANLLDKVREYERAGGSGNPDGDTIAAGLREALSIGARNGVSLVSRPDGYFGNPLIRIPMPDEFDRIERMMRRFGFHREVDDFILTMNRAAEKAAPHALDLFLKAVKEMTIPDAVHILHGNDTAATDFLKAKTYPSIAAAFRPVVSAATADVGATRAFKEMMDKARTIPLLKRETIDLDEYVTSKALDGLFLMVGREEKKIRKDPAARVTDLLKKVFP